MDEYELRTICNHCGGSGNAVNGAGVESDCDYCEDGYLFLGIIPGLRAHVKNLDKRLKDIEDAVNGGD